MINLKQLFAKRLRAWMEQNGYSYYQLSKDLCIGKRAVCQWLMANTMPRADYLRDLVLLTGISADYWLGIDMEE